MADETLPGDCISLGTRVFDEKRPPPYRKDECEDEISKAPLGKKGERVTVSRELINQLHMWVRGRTRSGKTATTLLPLIMQMLLAFSERWRTTDGKERRRTGQSAVVVFDLKGEKGFQRSVHTAAILAGREFEFITLDPRTSWSFSLLSGITGSDSDVIRLATGWLSSIGGDLGENYGARYFTVQTLSLLIEVTKHLTVQKRNGIYPTIREAIRYLRKNNRSAPKDSESLVATLSLLDLPHLQPTDADKHVVDLVDVIRKKKILMISVDTLNEGPVARLVAGLLLASLVAASTTVSAEHVGDPSPLPHTFCVIDEFHHIVTRNLDAFLTGAAGYGLTLALSCQTSETLRQKTVNLYETVRDNCPIKVLHSTFGKQDMDDLLACSRKTVRPLGGRKLGAQVQLQGRAALASESESDRVESLLTEREVQEVSARANRAIVTLDLGTGFIEPIPVDTHFAESHEQYLENKALPWLPAPGTAPGVHTAATEPMLADDTRPAWLRAHLADPKPKAHLERINRFADLLGRLEAEEQLSR